MINRLSCLFIFSILVMTAPIAHAYTAYGTFEPLGVQVADPIGGPVTPYSAPDTYLGLAIYNSEVYGLNLVNELQKLVGPALPPIPIGFFGPSVPTISLFPLYGGLAINSSGRAYAATDDFSIQAMNITGSPDLNTIPLLTPPSPAPFGISGLSFATSSGNGYQAGDLLAVTAGDIFRVDFNGEAEAELVSLWNFWGAPGVGGLLLGHGAFTSLATTSDGRLFIGTDFGIILDVDQDTGAVIPVRQTSNVPISGLAIAAPQPIPEPSTFALLGLALLGLFGIKRFRKA